MDDKLRFKNEYHHEYMRMSQEQKSLVSDLEADGFILLKEDALDDNPASTRKVLKLMKHQKKYPGNAFILKLKERTPQVIIDFFLSTQDLAHTNIRCMDIVGEGVPGNKAEMYDKGMEAIQNAYAAFKKAVNDLSMGVLGKPVARKPGRTKTEQQVHHAAGVKVKESKNMAQGKSLMDRLKDSAGNK